MCQPLTGFILGIPQVIGGCQNATQITAACSLPTSTVFGVVSTSTNRLIGVPTDLNTSASGTVPSVDFTFTYTSEGFYKMAYKGKNVVAELTNTGGRLVLSPRTGAEVDIKYLESNNSVLLIRVKGNYAVTRENGSLVPSFSVSPESTTLTFILGSQLSQLEGQTVIIPLLLSQDAYNVAGSLPGSAATTQWNIGDVTPQGTIINWPLSADCKNNRNDPLGGNNVPITGIDWKLWGVALLGIIILIIAFIIAFSLRRKEEVHDPAIYGLLAAKSSLGK
jgi:hypothetical protein